MKISAGRGKGSLAGSTPVLIFEAKLELTSEGLVIRDEDWQTLLYGWSAARLAAERKVDQHRWHFLHGISVDVFTAYLGVIYGDRVGELLATRPLTNGVLMEIDRLIELSLKDAEAIQRLQADDEEGKIDAWLKERQKGGS